MYKLQVHLLNAIELRTKISIMFVKIQSSPVPNNDCITAYNLGR